MDEKTIWDKIACEQTIMRKMAQEVKQMWSKLDTLPQEELVKIFVAICRSGEDYDPNMLYRKRILNLISDEFLCELIGLRIPVELNWEFEKRFWVVEKKKPDPPFVEDVDITEITD